MLALSDAFRYFLYAKPCDMRKSFYSLAALVREELHTDPLSGDIFIFLSRRRTQIKLLRWEGDGFALYSKRLESGTYELPKAEGDPSFCFLIKNYCSSYKVSRWGRYNTVNAIAGN